jgi:hypothetical protein
MLDWNTYRHRLAQKPGFQRPATGSTAFLTCRAPACADAGAWLVLVDSARAVLSHRAVKRRAVWPAGLGRISQISL